MPLKFELKWALRPRMFARIGTSGKGHEHMARPNLVEVGQCCARFGRSRHMSTKVGPPATKFGLASTKFR